MKKSKVRRRLDTSLSAGRIVTVVRDKFEITMTEGFVISMADDWVVMHVLADGVYLDAIVMMRLRDISRVWSRDDDPYHHRAIAGLGVASAAFDCDPTDGAAELLKKASAHDAIITFHCERLEGEPFLVGRLTSLRKKSFDLHYVGRDGLWARQIEQWKYRDITRIEMGGRYLQALNTFADPYPLKEVRS